MINYKSIKNYIFLAIYVIIALYLCLKAGENASQTAQSSGQIIDQLNKIPPYKDLSTKVPNFDLVTRKLLGHFSLYSALGFFSFLTYYSFINNKNIALSVNFISGFALAGITEIIQVFSAGREAAFQDVIINYEGFLLAQSLILLFIFLFFVEDKEKLRLWNSTNITNISVSILTLLCFLIFAKKTLPLKTCNYIFTVVSLTCFAVIAITYLLRFKPFKKS